MIHHLKRKSSLVVQLETGHRIVEDVATQAHSFGKLALVVKFKQPAGRPGPACAVPARDPPETQSSVSHTRPDTGRESGARATFALGHGSRCEHRVNEVAVCGQKKANGAETATGCPFCVTAATATDPDLPVGLASRREESFRGRRIV